MLFAQDKKVLVTGGTSGLGKAIALGFMRQGAHVAVWGTNLEKAKKCARDLQEARHSDDQRVWFETVNVAKTADVDAGFERLISAWGSVDVVINCAGITRDMLFLKMKEDDWDAVLDVNLKSVYNVSHAAIRPMMRARSGKIINIASVIGLTGNPGQVNYSASKMGMIGLTKSLAKEVASRGICVNCIAPGFFKTEMTDKLTDSQKEMILQKIPMGKMGDPNDIANAALFLASSMSDYITGQVITVDGGMIA